MARIGRTQPPQAYTGAAGHRILGPAPPQKILPLPTLAVQTVVVRLASGYRRRVETRTFPRQWYEPSTTKTTGAGSKTLWLTERGLGPDSPGLILPLPSQAMQTVVVRLMAGYRRRVEPRTFPKQWYEPAETKTSGAGSQMLWLTERAVGPDPPAVILPLPSLAMQTVMVTCVARRTVVEYARRAARVKVLAAPAVVGPPVLAPFAPIDVALRAVARRIQALNEQPHWKLSGPTVLALPPPLAPVAVSCVAIRTRVERPRRGSGGAVLPPVAVAVSTFSGPDVFLTRPPRRLRPGKAVLAAPLLTAAAPAVAAVRVVRPLGVPRRALRSVLTPPAVVAAAAQPPVVTSLEVVKAPRLARRRTRSLLAPPTVVSVAQPPVVTSLTVVRAPTRPRLRLRSRLAPPVVVTQPTAAVVDRLVVRLARARRPGAGHTLGPPVVVSVAVALSGPSVYPTHPVRRGRVGKALLAPPATLQAAAAPVVTQIRVARPTLVPRRRTHSALLPPAVVTAVVATPPFPPVTVIRAARSRRPLVGHQLAPPTLVTAPPLAPPLVVRLAPSRARRLTRSEVVPPTTVAAAPVVAPFAPVTVAKAPPRARRSLRSVLSPPTVVTAASARGSDRIAVRLAPARRPRVGYQLSSPVVVATPPPVAPLAVRLVAVRTRLELPRHSGRNRLGPPTKVIPPPTLRVQTIEVWTALRPRVELPRHAPHFRLAPPTVVAPPPTLVQQTVAVRLAVPLSRRFWHSRLAPPVVVKPRRHDDRGHGGGGFPPRWAERLLAQLAEGGRDALADEEIALLLLLGYL